MEWIQASYLLPLWLQVATLLSLTSTKELKECITQRRRCTAVVFTDPSQGACLYPCDSQGRLPHPNGYQHKYLWCRGPQYAACECTCRSHKQYNSSEGRCTKNNITYLISAYSKRLGIRRRSTQYTINDNVNAANTNRIIKTPYPICAFEHNKLYVGHNKSEVALVSTRTPPDDNERNSNVTFKSAYGRNKVANEVLKPNTSYPKETPLKVITEEIQHTGGIASPSMHQLTKAMSILEDDAVFPAWAIALVVLCLVILCVLVILILY